MLEGLGTRDATHPTKVSRSAVVCQMRSVLILSALAMTPSVSGMEVIQVNSSRLPFLAKAAFVGFCADATPESASALMHSTALPHLPRHG